MLQFYTSFTLGLAVDDVAVSRADKGLCHELFDSDGGPREGDGLYKLVKHGPFLFGSCVHSVGGGAAAAVLFVAWRRDGPGCHAEAGDFVISFLCHDVKEGFAFKHELQKTEIVTMNQF